MSDNFKIDDSEGKPVTLAAKDTGAGGKAVVAGALYTASPPTLTDGQRTALLVDDTGALKVAGSFSAAAPTINTEGSVAPGAAATKSALGGGQYNTSAPTLTNGQQVALQVDVNGNLKTTGGGGGGGGAATIADGADVAQGTTTDVAWTTGAGTTIGLLKGIFGKFSAVVLAAGTALIGKVGIDQTTPGTTNKVSIGTDGTVALNAAIPAGTNLVGKVGLDQTTPGTTNKVSIGTDGTVAINTALPAGTNLLGKVGLDQTTPGTTNKVSIGTDGVLAAGTAVIGKVGVDQTTPGTSNALVVNDRTGADAMGAVTASPTANTLLGRLKDLLSLIVLAAGENHIGEIGGRTALVTGNFTRPADTTAYTVGDLVANSTTAGSVVPVTLAVGRTASGAGASGMVRRAQIVISGTVLTNAQFRIHLFNATSITFAGGDNAAWSQNKVANYLGRIDITVDEAFTDGCAGHGAPVVGSEINFTTQNIYAVIEARAAFTPISAEVFTVNLEVVQN